MSQVHTGRRLAVVIWACVAATGAAGQAERQLPGSALTIPGYGPILLADLNADGRLDLAYTDPDFDDGAVRLARPDFTYGPPTTYLKAQFPVAAADFTEDGAVDLASFNTTLRVLPGLGDGTFGPVIKTLGTGSSNGIAPVADVDDDGHLDLAWAPYGSSAVFIQPGLGNGMFGIPPVIVPFGTDVWYHGLADVDEDGDLDVYGSTQSDATYYAQLSWCPNLGNGTFGPAANTMIPGDGFADRIAPHDFDADGLLDFVVSGGSLPTVSQISLLRNLGSAFQILTTIPLLPPSTAVYHDEPEVWIGDVDGDDTADLLVGSEASLPATGQTFFLKGHGGFVFDPPLASDTDFSAGPSLGPIIFHFADLDGDGHIDVLARSSASSIPTFAICEEIAWGRGDGTFETPTHLDTGESFTAVAAADVDGDGACDVLGTSIENAPHVSARLGLGDGTFSSQQLESPATFAEDLFVADGTGDGVPDALTTSPQSTGGGMFLVGAGDGTFTGRSPVVTGRVRDAAFGDVDGDGVLDLAVSQPDAATVALLKGVGDGSFLAAGSVPAGADCGGLELADVTLDGYADVIVTHEAGASILLVPLGRGFGMAPGIELPTGQMPHDVLALDIDSDGDLDFATACGDLEYFSKDTLVSVHRLTNGTPGPSETWVAELTAGALASGDFDRDGLPDLVVTMLDQPYEPAVPVEILHGGPGGTRGESVALRTGGRVSGTSVADFDGDALPDLVMALTDDPELRIHLNRTQAWSTLGHALPSSDGVPLLSGSGTPAPNEPVDVIASLVPQPTLGLLFVGLAAPFTPLAGGFLVPSPDVLVPVQPDLPLHARWPAGLPSGTAVYLQAWFQSAATGELSASNALVTIAQ